jgi:hypothetical protein
LNRPGYDAKLRPQQSKDPPRSAGEIKTYNSCRDRRLGTEGQRSTRRHQGNSRKKKEDNPPIGVPTREWFGTATVMEGGNGTKFGKNQCTHPVGHEAGVEREGRNPDNGETPTEDSGSSPGQESTSDRKDGTQEPHRKGRQSTQTDHLDDVGRDMPTCGFGKHCTMDTCGERHSPREMGNVQVGLVRNEKCVEMCEARPDLYGATPVGGISQLAVVHEVSGTGLDIIQYKDEAVDHLGDRGILKQGDWDPVGTYTDGRSTPISTRVCDTQSTPTGAPIAAENEHSPGGMGTGVTVELSEEETQKIQQWAIQHLDFSQEEWDVLGGYTPKEDVDLKVTAFSSGKESRITVNGKGLRHHRKPCNLPLAAITENRIDLDALMTLPLAPPEELVEYMSWIRTDRIWEMVQHEDYWKIKNEKRHFVSRYLDREMTLLESIGVVGRGYNSLGVEIPLFKVPKSDGGSRLIADCRGLNSLLPPPPPMGLPSIREVIKRLLRKNWLWQVDARSYFYQFRLKEEIAPLFALRVGGPRGIFSKGHLKVLPMGFKYAPGIAQWTSLHIAANACIGGTSDVMIPWVDNFLSGADTQEEIINLVGRFEEITKKVSLECKPTVPPARTMEALGLVLNVEADDMMEHFVCLTEKYQKDLQEEMEKISGEMSARQVLQLFGKLMWPVYTIGREPLCMVPEVMDYVRHIAKEMSICPEWDKVNKIPMEVGTQLREFGFRALRYRLTLRDLEENDTEAEVWTDASSTGWGYIIQETDTMKVAEESHSLPIFVAELLAAADALYTAKKEGKRNILSVIDNSAARNALSRGHSSSKAGDIILRRLVENLGERRAEKTAWIGTKDMIADPVSRGKPVERKSKGQIQGRTWSWIPPGEKDVG